MKFSTDRNKALYLKVPKVGQRETRLSTECGSLDAQQLGIGLWQPRKQDAIQTSSTENVVECQAEYKGGAANWGKE